MTVKKQSIICIICGEEMVVSKLQSRATKYCNKCKIPVQRAQAKAYARNAQNAWNSLDDEERLRRANLCAKRFLEAKE